MPPTSTGFAAAAIALNCGVNGVHVEVLDHNLLDGQAPLEPRYDVILVGDLCYEADTAARVLGFLDRHAACGSNALLGDPGRAYLPAARLASLSEYTVP